MRNLPARVQELLDAIPVKNWDIIDGIEDNSAVIVQYHRDHQGYIHHDDFVGEVYGDPDSSSLIARAPELAKDFLDFHALVMQITDAVNTIQEDPSSYSVTEVAEHISQLIADTYRTASSDRDDYPG